MAKMISMFSLIIGSCFSAQAQDTTGSAAAATDTTKPAPSPTPTITGSVDLYYRYNFANSKTSFNNLTSFTNSQNSFELGMASVRADHSWGKASATLDLGFGRRAQEFSYNDGSGNPYFSLANVKQAFLSYAFSDRFKITAGKWGTHIGYEVVDAYLNRNYSMSYMFSYGPFFHTGVKADITIAGKTALMVGIASPTDASTTESSHKFAIAQLSSATADGKWKFFLNYQGGKYDLGSTLNQLDLTLTGVITDKFSVGYNGTVQFRKPEDGSSDSWWGSAVYLNVDPTSKFGLTLRGEYFDDSKNIITANGGKYTEFTLSGNVHLGKLTFIPELRYDNSSTSSFEKNDGTATKNTFSAILAATYSF